MKTLLWIMWAMVILLGSFIKERIGIDGQYLCGFIVGTVAVTILRLKDLLV